MNIKGSGKLIDTMPMYQFSVSPIFNLVKINLKVLFFYFYTIKKFPPKIDTLAIVSITQGVA